MNKILTGLLVIVIGVTGIAVVDGFSEGLMTSVESTTQTETDYTGVLSDIDLTIDGVSIIDLDDNAGAVCYSPDEKWVFAGENAVGGNYDLMYFNESTGVWEDKASEITIPDIDGALYGCGFSPDSQTLIISTATDTAGEDFGHYNLVGTTWVRDTDITTSNPAKMKYIQTIVFIDNNTFVAGTVQDSSQYGTVSYDLIGDVWTPDTSSDIFVSTQRNYDIDIYVEGSDEYVITSLENSPYIHIIKNDVELSLSLGLTGAQTSRFSPSGNRVATATGDSIKFYTFDGSSLSSMNITTDPTDTDNIYELEFVTDDLVLVVSNMGGYLYSFDGTTWDIEETNLMPNGYLGLSILLSRNKVVISTASAGSRVDSYTTTLTTTGDSITLENTPDSITSVTHNGVSKAYTLLGTELTPTNPELSGDLLVVYDYEITGDYPLLNIVPIVFAVAVLGFVVSLIIFKRE